MKKTIAFVSSILMLVAFTGCNAGSQVQNSSAEIETEQTTVAPETTEELTETEPQTESETEALTSISAEEAEENTSGTDEEPVETAEHRTGDEIVGISAKKLTDNDITIDLTKSVNGDVTGNWRLVRMTDNIDFTEFGLDYYTNYFESSDEVHVIVNFSQNTTTIVNYMLGMLDVTVHEYVEDEEHDASTLGNGNVLAEYFIYTDNGDIEKVQ